MEATQQEIDSVLAMVKREREKMIPSYEQSKRMNDSAFRRFAMSTFTSELSKAGWTWEELYEMDLRIAHMRKDEMYAKARGV